MPSFAFNRRRLFSHAAMATGVGVAMNMFPDALKKSLGAENLKPAKFKYSFCNEVFGNQPFGQVCELLAGLGYEGVEIAPFTVSNFVTDIPSSRRAEMRGQAEKAGLKIVGLHWLLAKTKGLHLTTADAEVRRNTSKYLGELARFCSDLGGKVMVFGSPNQRNLAPGMSKEQGMKHAAEVLQAAMPALEKANVTLAFESLAPKETNFINTAADAVKLAEAVDSPHCRIVLDCKAMSSERQSKPTDPTPYPWMPELIHKYHGKWMVHFHANDPNMLGPGFGKLDFVPIMRALRAVNYCDWVSVEPFDYSPGPERLARESLEYLRKCSDKAGA